MPTSYSCGRRGNVVTTEMASMIPATSSVSRCSHGFLSSSCRALDGHRSIARNLLPGRVTNHSERFLQEAQARRPWDSFAPVQTLVWTRGAHWSVSKVLATRARVEASTHACASLAPWPVSPRSRYYWADEEPAARADAAQSSRRELIPSFM
jgi:hypothetical protein